MQNNFDNIIINSGPGTGKTEYMKQSIRDHLLDGMPTDNILGFTFTNAAAKNMQDRLKEFKGLKVQNIHSFCMNAMNHRVDIIPDDIMTYLVDLMVVKGKSRFDSISATAVKSAMDRWRIFVFMRTENKTYKDYLDSISDMQLLEEYFKESNITEPNDIKNQTNLFRRAIRILETINYLGYTDFFGLVVEGYFTIRLPYVKYILVDEFQDLTYIEYRAITSISPNAKFLFLCDTNQGIYSWRHSSFSLNQEHFKMFIGPLREINLEKNYRCSKSVLKLTNELTGKEDVAASDEEGSVTSLKVKDGELLDRVRDVCLGKKRDSTLAFLVQSNIRASEIVNFLKSEKIPVHHKIRNNLESFTPIRLALKLMQYTHCSFNTSALKALCLDPYLAQQNSEDMLALLKLMQQGFSSEYISYGDKSVLYKEQEGETYVIFDTETTGTDVDTDDIIQIAGIKLNSKLEEIDRLNIYLKTDKPLGDSVEVHNITEETLKTEGLDRVEGLHKALEFFNGSVMVAHNTSFDSNILYNNCANLNLLNEFTMSHWVDTLDLARVYLKDLNLPNFKLGTLAEELKFETTPNHNAMFDVEATVELFRYIVNKTRKEIPNSDEYLLKAIGYAKKIDTVVANEGFYTLADILDYCASLVNKFDGREVVFWENFESQIEMLTAKGLSPLTILEYFNLKSDAYDSVGAITVCTVHQSKGLEFDNVVFIQDYTSSNTEDSKNVENVAVSRAKDSFKLFRMPKVRESRIESVICKMEEEVNSWK